MCHDIKYGLKKSQLDGDFFNLAEEEQNLKLKKKERVKKEKSRKVLQHQQGKILQHQLEHLQQQLTYSINFLNLVKERAADDSNKTGSKILDNLELNTNSFSEGFIYKFNNKSHEEFINYLCDHFISTVDHIDLHSSGGKNSDSNYLLCCKACNTLRGDIEIKDWLKLNPDFRLNIFKSLDELDAKMPETSYKQEVSEHINNLISN